MGRSLYINGSTHHGYSDSVNGKFFIYGTLSRQDIDRHCFEIADKCNIETILDVAKVVTTLRKIAGEYLDVNKFELRGQFHFSKHTKEEKLKIVESINAQDDTLEVTTESKILNYMTYDEDLIKDKVQTRIDYYDGTELDDFTKGEDVDEYIFKVVEKCDKLFSIYWDIMDDLFNAENEKSQVRLELDD